MNETMITVAETKNVTIQEEENMVEKIAEIYEIKEVDELIKYIDLARNGMIYPDVMEALYDDILEKVEDVITMANSEDVYEYFCGSNEDVYPMRELDDVFSYMSISEALEELRDIDLCDEWFNSDTRNSGYDIWDVMSSDVNDVAERIVENEDETGYEPVDEIIRNYNSLTEAIDYWFEEEKEKEEKAKEEARKEKVRKMFEKMLEENGVDEMMLALARI